MRSESSPGSAYETRTRSDQAIDSRIGIGTTTGPLRNAFLFRTRG